MTQTSGVHYTIVWGTLHKRLQRTELISIKQTLLGFPYEVDITQISISNRHCSDFQEVLPHTVTKSMHWKKILTTRTRRTERGIRKSWTGKTIQCALGGPKKLRLYLHHRSFNQCLGGSLARVLLGGGRPRLTEVSYQR